MTRCPQVAVVDFETKKIDPRPHYPPKPVGVAIKLPRERVGKYWAFGHPNGTNNCTERQARDALRQAMRDHVCLFHHAGFDLDVAETHWELRWPAEHHDTLIMAFLHDPDSDSLSLKPLAERHLGEPPDEQNRLHDWIVQNVVDPKTGRSPTKKTAGAFISEAPGVDLVAPYALGDVGRTERLFKFLWDDIADTRLSEAYTRERKLTRTLVRMERRGVPVDVRLIEADIARYELIKRELESWLLRKLKVPKKFHGDVLDNYDEQEHFKWGGKGFAEQLVSSGLVESLPLTDKGNPSTSAESLITVMPPKLAKEFEVRAQLATCLQTFMRPWLAMGRETGGLFHARFNQVRNGDEWGKKTGARTGRLSMTPNLQNMIRGDKDERVPRLRRYIAAPRGLIAKRDYSQQELRILAHYEHDAYSRRYPGQVGPFKRAYDENPALDAHMLVKGLIQETTGLVLERRPVKDLNFGLIYGQGLALTAEKMGLPREEARRARAAHAQSLPGIPILQAELKERVALKEPIWTSGGRRYYCEPPAFVNGRWATFEYKMLNKLIQGSAADCTKDAMVNYDSTPIADEHPLILQVHDELLALSATVRAARLVHETMRDCMADVQYDVPMLSDGSMGKNYGEMEDIKW